jgi:hypothetical protein
MGFNSGFKGLKRNGIEEKWMSPNTNKLKFWLKSIIISFISAEIYELQKQNWKKKLFQQIIFSKNMLKFSKAALSMYIWIAFEF